MEEWRHQWRECRQRWMSGGRDEGVEAAMEKWRQECMSGGRDGGV